MIQQFTIPPGGRIVNAAGNFFRYEQAGADSIDQQVKLRVNGNDLGTYLPGDSIELPIDANTWELMQASGSGHTVRIGKGRIITSRTVLTGTINVTDAGEASTLGGQSFMGFALAAASGTQFSAVGLYNASGTKTIYVKRLVIGAREGTIGWKLARNSGAPPGAQVTNAANGGKLFGAVQQGRMYSAFAQVTTFFPTSGMVDFPVIVADWANDQNAKNGFEVLARGDEPIAIAAGWSLVLYHSTAAAASSGYGCHMLAHWVER